MAITSRTPNPLIQRMQSDGVFGAGLPQPDNQLSTESKLNRSMQGTFNAFRSGLGPQTDFGAINTAANQPSYDAFFLGATPSLANMGLHPSGGPTTSYAPTGLRQQAIDAGGAPVTGFGGATATAAPNVQGGTAFTLSQARPPVYPIDPNPTPAAMQFLQDGVAPTSPGPFPRLGVPAAQTNPPVTQTAPVAQMPFSATGQPLSPQSGLTPDNSMFRQAAPQGGLANYLPKGPPEQVKAQLGVMQNVQKMQQEAMERNAIAAAHAPGVSDGLSTYLQHGGRDMQVINSFKKDAQATESLGLKKDAAAQKQADATNATHEAARQGLESADQAIKAIDQIMPNLNSATTGIAASLTSAIPGTPAYAINEQKKFLTSKITTSTLQAIRAAAKNGASGFGQLSEKEGELLGNSLGNLNLAQDTKQVAKTMQDVRSHFLRLKATYKMGLVDPKAMTSQDKVNQDAVKWALDHPDDSRSEAILLHNQ